MGVYSLLLGIKQLSNAYAVGTGTMRMLDVANFSEVPGGTYPTAVAECIVDATEACVNPPPPETPGVVLMLQVMFIGNLAIYLALTWDLVNSIQSMPNEANRRHIKRLFMLVAIFVCSENLSTIFGLQYFCSVAINIVAASHYR
mmetsp:Transcript_4561/g.6797  ORF Transcript_4561/g.6797 Transcript_4561/m.6797 type:complete len:144 (-) Transcript_4561:2609-3040(-)